MRGKPGQNERNAFALVDNELRDRAHVLATCVDRRAERERIGTGESDASVLLVGSLPHPGDHAAVAEADCELRAEVDAPADAFHDPDDVRRVATRRHEVEDARNGAVLRLPGRLEHERVVEVAAGARRGSRRSEQPTAVLLVAEQRSEAGCGVEAGKAEPVDRTAAVDECRGVQVSKEGVVLDAGHQRFSISQPQLGPALANRAVEGVLVRLGCVLVESSSEAVAHVRERLGCGLHGVREVAVHLLAILAGGAFVDAEPVAAFFEQIGLVLDEEIELAADHVAEGIAAESHVISS